MDAIIPELIVRTLQSVDPLCLIQSTVFLEKNILKIRDKQWDLDQFERIHIIGAGKAAPFLCEGLSEKLGDKIFRGLVVSIRENRIFDSKVQFIEGSHPVPTKKSLQAGKLVSHYVNSHVRGNDLVLGVITGGASSLMVLPSDGIVLGDKISMNEKLLKSGLDIRETNCIRKHMSAIKGGKLAEKIYPATVISLILSDIVDSPKEDIGSGPFVGDSSSFADCWEILSKKWFLDQMRPELVRHFEDGKDGKFPDTLPPDHPMFSHNRHFLLGDIKLALESVKEWGEEKKWEVRILSSCDSGDVKKVAAEYGAAFKKAMKARSTGDKPLLLISGGELTVEVTGTGKGGRNQEYVMLMLRELKGINSPFLLGSFGTDGIDGCTDAAGAWIDHQSRNHAEEIGINMADYCANNDSYHLFKKMNQLIVTGPTRTNVMDFRFCLIY